jgi:hypothetical protein
VAGDINFSGNMRLHGNQVLSADESNTALGIGALTANTDSSNTAIGSGALQINTTGGLNTATGFWALQYNLTGGGNTATGYEALENNSTGGNNTAIGVQALWRNQVGMNNIAVGASAMLNSDGGSNNIAIGNFAGVNLFGGNDNVEIASSGDFPDNGVIRIGTPGRQSAFFAAGVRGVTTRNNNAIPVVIDSNGQLGTVSSSRRYKEDIQDMREASSGLMRLRPVTFRYQKPFADGSKPVQYGLIAEEVAEVYPDLVARSADGQVETVKYQVLDSMLLNEVQRLSKENRDLQQRLGRLEAAMARIGGLRFP